MRCLFCLVTPFAKSRLDHPNLGQALINYFNPRLKLRIIVLYICKYLYFICIISLVIYRYINREQGISHLLAFYFFPQFQRLLAIFLFIIQLTNNFVVLKLLEVILILAFLRVTSNISQPIPQVNGNSHFDDFLHLSPCQQNCFSNTVKLIDRFDWLIW